MTNSSLSRGLHPVTGATMMALLCTGLASCGHKEKATPAAGPLGPPTVELSPQQLRVISVGTVSESGFSQQVGSFGNIDFDEDRTVQVFTPYQGKIIKAFFQLGDPVRKGEPLFTVESADLLAADLTLVSAEATEEANRKALERAKKLQVTQGISQQNVEQAVSAEAASNAALMSARAAIAVFGKSSRDIDAVARHGRADPELVVRSPISGRITARSAQPGLLVQPGNAPAPYTVGNTSIMWMLANASESDAAKFRVGQQVEASVAALPGQTLSGRILAIGASVDPNAHTVQLRAAIANPHDFLKSGMQANFIVHTGAAEQGLAIPVDGVVREGDGTLTAWATTDGRHFEQRVIKVGLTRNGFDQVLSGLRPGEHVVTKGAVYLDNMLAVNPDDD